MREGQHPARWRWRVAQADHLELRAGIGIPQQLSRADDIVRLPREGRIGALLSRIGALLSEPVAESAMYPDFPWSLLTFTGMEVGATVGSLAADC